MVVGSNAVVLFVFGFLQEYVPVPDETIANMDWGVVVPEVPKPTVGFSALQTTEVAL